MKPRSMLLLICLMLLAAPAISRAAAKHVIIISIDGLHQADLADPALQSRIPGLLALARGGVWYSNATGMSPADSFPGTLAYLTGAGPATTGVYYDDTYCRNLIAPGGSASGPLGTAVQNTEVIDRNYDLIDGGGDCGLGSIDRAKLPIDPARGGAPVYPHDYLKVNTIFEIAHAAGLKTAMLDKHPAYEIASGPSGKGVDDLYCPEIEAKAAIVGGKLVDAQTAPKGTKLKGINKDVRLAMAYDDLKIAALLRQIHGQDARGIGRPGMPALVVINLQALNVAEKDPNGGIDLTDGKEAPSQLVLEALQHTDAVLMKVRDELNATGLWDQTLIVVTAKHGQDPRIGTGECVNPSTLVDPLKLAGIELAGSTFDDVALLWLKDSSQTARAADTLAALQAGQNNPGILRVLWGDALQNDHLAGARDRTPDLILSLKPGTLLTEKGKRSEHGGFCEDDTRVPLVLTGGAVDEQHRGIEINAPVKTTQIAVTVLQSLGLDSGALQGALIEKTQALPGNGIGSMADAR